MKEWLVKNSIREENTNMKTQQQHIADSVKDIYLGKKTLILIILYIRHNWQENMGNNYNKAIAPNQVVWNSLTSLRFTLYFVCFIFPFLIKTHKNPNCSKTCHQKKSIEHRRKFLFYTYIRHNWQENSYNMENQPKKKCGKPGCLKFLNPQDVLI